MSNWSNRHKNPLCRCKSSGSKNDIHSIILSGEKCTLEIKFHWDTSDDQETTD